MVRLTAHVSRQPCSILCDYLTPRNPDYRCSPKHWPTELCWYGRIPGKLRVCWSDREGSETWHLWWGKNNVLFSQKRGSICKVPNGKSPGKTWGKEHPHIHQTHRPARPLTDKAARSRDAEWLTRRRLLCEPQLDNPKRHGYGVGRARSPGLWPPSCQSPPPWPSPSAQPIWELSLGKRQAVTAHPHHVMTALSLLKPHTTPPCPHVDDIRGAQGNLEFVYLFLLLFPGVINRLVQTLVCIPTLQELC